MAKNFKKWFISMFSLFRAKLENCLFLILFEILDFGPNLYPKYIYAVLMLFEGPNGKCHAKFVFLTNF
jgi:hypothetical protein